MNTRDPERFFAEAIAQAVTRRRFLRRASQWTFSAVSGLTVAGVLARESAAHTRNGQAHCANHDNETFCTPPHGAFCTGCIDHQCPSGYYWTTQWGYDNWDGGGPTGSACWCTNANPFNGQYYICCDCSTVPNATQQYPGDCGCFSVERVRAPAP